MTYFMTCDPEVTVSIWTLDGSLSLYLPRMWYRYVVTLLVLKSVPSPSVSQICSWYVVQNGLWKCLESWFHFTRPHIGPVQAWMPHPMSLVCHQEHRVLPISVLTMEHQDQDPKTTPLITFVFLPTWTMPVHFVLSKAGQVTEWAVPWPPVQ